MNKTSHKQSAQVAPTSVGVEGSGQKIAEAAEAFSENSEAPTAVTGEASATVNDQAHYAAETVDAAEEIGNNISQREICSVDVDDLKLNPLSEACYGADKPEALKVCIEEEGAEKNTPVVAEGLASKVELTAEDKEMFRSIHEYAAKQVKTGKLDKSMLEKIKNAAPFSESATYQVTQWQNLAIQTLKTMSSDQSAQERWLDLTKNGEDLERRLFQGLDNIDTLNLDEDETPWMKAIIGTRFIAGGFELLCSDEEHRREMIAVLDQLQLQYDLEASIRYFLESRRGTSNCAVTLRELTNTSERWVWEVQQALERLIFCAVAYDYGLDIHYGPMNEVDPIPAPAPAPELTQEDKDALKSTKEHIEELEYFLHMDSAELLSEAAKSDLGRAISRLNTAAAVMAGIKVTVD